MGKVKTSTPSAIRRMQNCQIIVQTDESKHLPSNESECEKKIKSRRLQLMKR